MPSKDPESMFEGLMKVMPQVGRVVWIGLRPGTRKDVIAVSSTTGTPGQGLEGDRFVAKGNTNREVTLIQGEHLDTVASILGKPIDPALIRRNLVVKGINLLALKNRQFRVGSLLLEYTGLCHPCSRMEENLGPGGYNAMRGHGGITARIVEGGIVELGDTVAVVE